jgi:hypothetical protein
MILNSGFTFSVFRNHAIISLLTLLSNGTIWDLFHLNEAHNTNPLHFLPISLMGPRLGLIPVQKVQTRLILGYSLKMCREMLYQCRLHRFLQCFLRRLQCRLHFGFVHW